ncbi:membrane protein required for colicin V production [Breoghania corrubedonensis]|uniref:Membrane protein required for colicin V production n=1 Tax=Breoghania corrubedonensis TaxID=665038 RepID=A0A2T5V9P6_9HYPH|nr:CvpA family protein [Breoghania corrubedonensis]PTW60454.1 membrane protein required for colicin V production [Breoghania corrubedonensis]
MPITLLDGILIVIMLISAVLAMIRGFVREVLSIVSWLAAAVAAYMFYDDLLPFLKQYISHEQIALGASVAVIFLVTLIIVSYITMRISDFVLDSRIGALDRSLGFVFGAARGLLLVVVAMLFFNWFVQEPKQPGWVANAKSRPLLNSIGQRLIAALPEDPESEIINQLRNRGTKRNDDAATPAAENDDNAGYSERERSGINQQIEATQPAN